MERKGIIGKILACVAVVGVFLGIVCGVRYAYSSREVVGVVGNTKITTSEFVFVLKSVRSMLEQSMLSPTATKAEKDSFWSSVKDGKTASEKADIMALEEAKKIKIQLIRAKGNNIELTKEEKEKNKKEINEMIEKLGGKAEAGDRIRMVYGVSIAEYRKIREEMSLIDKYANFEKSKMELSEEDITEEYNKNYENPDQVTVQHILISTVDTKGQELPEDKFAEAQKLANELVDRAKAGEDFGTLVKDYTADISSRDTKGQYTMRKGQMVPEFEAWAFNSKPGDIDVVKTDYGFHIMKKPIFDELKEDIKDRVLGEKYNVMLDEWSKVALYDIKVNGKALKNAKIIAEEE